jgi:hypothetical protein
LSEFAFSTLLSLLRKLVRIFTSCCRDSLQYPLNLPSHLKLVYRAKWSVDEGFSWSRTASAPSWNVIGPAGTDVSSNGPLGTGHPFGRRSRGTGLPRSRSAENVQLRVEPNPPATLITSNLTKVRSRFSCNMRIPKACAVTTTLRIGIKKDAANPPSEQANQ